EAWTTPARAGGHRSGGNPATWAGNLKHLLAAPTKLARGHHEAMPYKDLPAFMARLRGQDGMGAKALQFAILTAARSGEARGVTWAEIDLEARVWVIPGKAGKEHRVPLSEAAMAVLRHMASIRTDDRPDALIFPGGRVGQPLSDVALATAVRTISTNSTVHGFRSTFRDWAGDCTHFPREIAEAALAHKAGDATEIAYRRPDAIE